MPQKAYFWSKTEMAKTGVNSELCFLMLLAVCLLPLPSCKESSEKSPPEDMEQQAVNEEKVAEANTADTELVPIDIKLPRQVYVGTKENIRVSNLEPLRKKQRAPFYAPSGTGNVALGKPVTGTEQEPVWGDMAMLTDGDKEATDGSYVELGPFKQTVTIDLQAEHEIYAILFWHYHKQPRVYFDVIAQVADDPDFITNVRTLFNNDNDNSSGLGTGKDMHYVDTYEGKLIDAKGIHGRYVRLYSNGNNTNDYNHYIEVEVFGKPAK
jgi:hypothetical protein